jgi:hypothetical protein
MTSTKCSTRPTAAAAKQILESSGRLFASTSATAFRMNEVRFFWSLHGVVLTQPPSMHTDGTAANLEEAKAQFQKSWDAWKAWAKLKEAQ